MWTPLPLKKKSVKLKCILGLLGSLCFMQHFLVKSTYYLVFLKNYLFIYLFIYCFLGLHLWHMEILRLGVESKL